MSVIEYDLDYKLWERYLGVCRDEQVKPSLSDFKVWCDEQDLDEPDWEDGDERPD